MSKKKLYALGLDGVPFSLLSDFCEKNITCYLRKIFEEGDIKKMYSVYPTLSSVAWATLLTGKYPGSHGIFGFIDVRDDLSLFIPNYRDIKVKTLIEILSDYDKRVLHINLPITYPPPEVRNTVCISGFLAPSVDRAVYPRNLRDFLLKEKYVIDLDPWMAQDDRKKKVFYNELFTVTEKRFKVCEEIIKKEDFDVIMLNIMETDRLLHFFIKDFDKLRDYFSFLDKRIGLFFEKNLKDEDELIIFSDHGSKELKKSLNIFYLLKSRGLLKFKGNLTYDFRNIIETSKVFTLAPGRIYLFKKERFPKALYRENEIREEVENFLKELGNYEGIGGYKNKYEIFGKEFISSAPDFIIIPEIGYDLKSEFNLDELYVHSPIVGVHSFDDAFIYIRGRKIVKDNVKIVDFTPTLLSLLNINYKDNFDGEVII
ncbi:MAG: alkaline phosphatase family protein [Candidatus Hydrothermales bacterium]